MFAQLSEWLHEVFVRGIDGWALLDLLKHDPQTRHIPIQIVSGGIR